jgi:hypothetical protein
VAEARLDEKVRLVRRSTRLQFPAILHVTASTLALTADELDTLIFQVMMLVQDLDTEDADGFYAEPSTFTGLRHLIGKATPDRHGPALCGAFPPKRADDRRQGCWMLLPFLGQPKTHLLCPTCLDLWETVQAVRQQEQNQTTGTITDTPLRMPGEAATHDNRSVVEVWYEA